MNKHLQDSVLTKAMARVRAKHGLPTHKAEDGEVNLVCPRCAYQGPESEFDEVQEPDNDDADGFRTDPVTSTSDGNADPDSEGDAAKVPKWDSKRIDRVAALAQSLRDAAESNKSE